MSTHPAASNPNWFDHYAVSDVDPDATGDVIREAADQILPRFSTYGRVNREDSSWITEVRNAKYVLLASSGLGSAKATRVYGTIASGSGTGSSSATERKQRAVDEMRQICEETPDRLW